MAILSQLVPRLLAGLLALICAAGVLLFGQFTIAMIVHGIEWSEIFRVRMTSVATGAVCGGFFLAAVWLCALAIRPGSTATEWSERGRGRQG